MTKSSNKWRNSELNNNYDKEDKQSMNHTEQWMFDIEGLMQERRNSIVNALELRISCTNLLINEKPEPSITKLGD